MGTPIAAVLYDCSICFDPMNERKQLIETVCTHIFHRTCLLDWIAHPVHGRDICPLCEGVDPIGQQTLFIDESKVSMESEKTESDGDVPPHLPVEGAIRELDRDIPPEAPRILPAPAPTPVAARGEARDRQGCHCTIL
jgi:hypothetical protein